MKVLISDHLSDSAISIFEKKGIKVEKNLEGIIGAYFLNLKRV